MLLTATHVAPDLSERANADGIEFLLALIVDLTGKPCAKLVPIEAVEQLRDESVGFAGYPVSRAGQGRIPTSSPSPTRRRSWRCRSCGPDSPCTVTPTSWGHHGRTPRG